MPATKKKTTKKASEKPPKAAKTASVKPIRREVCAFVCLFFGIFTFMGYFNSQAPVIKILCYCIKGWVGMGFFIFPPIMLFLAVMLAFHRGRPVLLRFWCVILLPVFIGSLLHLIFSKTELQWSAQFFKELFESGTLLESGGFMSGGLAIALKAVFGGVGTGIILIIVMLFFIFTALNLSVVRIYDALRSRPPLREYEEEPAPPATPPAARSKKNRTIDIPIDDPPVRAAARAEPSPGSGFFNTQPGVKTPAEAVDNSAMPSTPPSPAIPAAVLEKTPDTFKIVDNAPARVPVPPTAPLSVTAQPDSAAKEDEPQNDVQLVREVSASIENTLFATIPPAYMYPPLSLLSGNAPGGALDASEELRINAERLSDTVKSFNIEAGIINVTRGPSVTRYELELDKGVKLTRLTGLADDIALSLGAVGVRIAPIPDKISVVGVEVPNKLVSTVYIRDVLESQEFTGSASKISFAVGKDIGGNCIIGDIARLPHLLIAGTTGSGKSVCMNSLIISLLYKASPDDVRLIMIDPKMIELGVYNGIPHLLIPVVTDPKKASGALQWAVTEMMRRYKLFSELGVRDVFSYNEAAKNDPERMKLPQIVIVIDELADLMLVAAKEVEESVCRIAQMARAAGMHLIIATQRPSADVITGIMKANIPSRIAFAVASQLESRIILDTMGAEKLVGRGDMLFFPLGAGKPQRVQGCLISGAEVEKVVEFVKKTAVPEYSSEIMNHIEQHAEQKDKGAAGGVAQNGAGDDDDLLPAAVDVIMETGQASVSMLQRRLKLGYARAARLVDQMEERGIVGPFEGSKPRQLLITRAMWQEMQMRGDMTPVPERNDAAVQEDSSTLS